MTERLVTVSVIIEKANYASEREVLMEAIDALTFYSCTLPKGQLQPWIKEIVIT